ncbi:MAG: rubrerythrin [Bacteroidetes bacterium]|nr:rubrerythrin [Bacteroidota bacterium]
MKKFESIDEILDFAIENEDEAFIFYTNLANSMKNQNLRKMFEEFAGEEKIHKEKLILAKTGNVLMSSREKVMDLKISDYLVDVETNPKMDYQNSLIVAMKKEKKAFKLYMDLANASDDETVKNVFLFLVQEESKHKLKLEQEYDEHVLSEN